MVHNFLTISAKIILIFLLSLLACNLFLRQQPLLLAQTPPPLIPESTLNEFNTEQNKLLLPHNQEQEDNVSFLADTLLPGIAAFIISITGGLSLIFVIIGGLQMLTAYGDQEKITAGKKTIVWALIGMLIGILSYAIVTIISAISIN